LEETLDTMEIVGELPERMSVHLENADTTRSSPASGLKSWG
jgi:hypothetical protein